MRISMRVGLCRTTVIVKGIAALDISDDMACMRVLRYLYLKESNFIVLFGKIWYLHTWLLLFKSSYEDSRNAWPRRLQSKYWCMPSAF